MTELLDGGMFLNLNLYFFLSETTRYMFFKKLKLT